MVMAGNCSESAQSGKCLVTAATFKVARLLASSLGERFESARCNGASSTFGPPEDSVDHALGNILTAKRVFEIVKWLWWAPLFAVLAHIAEEFVYPGGFADWDRAYRPHYRSGITARVLIVVNVGLIALCVGIAASEDEISFGAFHLRGFLPARYAVVEWLTLAALLFANAIFHLKGTVETGRVSPGVGTGVLFYIPLATYGFWYFISAGRISPGAALLAALIGGSYEVWPALIYRLTRGKTEAQS
jgi:hypothetical protein